MSNRRKWRNTQPILSSEGRPWCSRRPPASHRSWPFALFPGRHARPWCFRGGCQPAQHRAQQRRHVQRSHRQLTAGLDVPEPAEENEPQRSALLPAEKAAGIYAVSHSPGRRLPGTAIIPVQVAAQFLATPVGGHRQTVARIGPVVLRRGRPSIFLGEDIADYLLGHARIVECQPRLAVQPGRVLVIEGPGPVTVCAGRTDRVTVPCLTRFHYESSERRGTTVSRHHESPRSRAVL